MRYVLRERQRVAVAGLILTTRSVRSSLGSDVRFGPESTEYEIGLNAGYAQALRDSLGRQARAA